MRATALLCLVLPCLFVSVANAQKTAPADAKSIEACLDKADKDGSTGFACAGAIADPCIKGVEKTNADVAASKKCAARELAVWTDLMAKALQGVKKGGFKETANATGSAQTAFAESMKSLCPVFDVIEPGMFLGGSNYCRLQETARRTIILRKLSAAVNEH